MHRSPVQSVRKMLQKQKQEIKVYSSIVSFYLVQQAALQMRDACLTLGFSEHDFLRFNPQVLEKTGVDSAQFTAVHGRVPNVAQSAKETLSPKHYDDSCNVNEGRNFCELI